MPEIFTNNWTTLPKTNIFAPEQKNDEKWEDPGSFWVFQGLFSGWKTVFFWGCKWWFQVFSIFTAEKPPRSNADSNVWGTQSNFLFRSIMPNEDPTVYTCKKHICIYYVIVEQVNKIIFVVFSVRR